MYYLFFVFRIWVSGGDGGVFFDGVGEFMGWIGDGLVVWVWLFVVLGAYSIRDGRGRGGVPVSCDGSVRDVCLLMVVGGWVGG